MPTSICLLVATSTLAADVAPIPFEKVVLESNGLEVIYSQNQALPLVSVNIWYRAGPRNEPPGRTGFAHLFEHLMFQGSAHVGDDQHFRLLETAGASMINGTTDYDRTNYFATVPSNQLELLLWLESDRMGFLLDTLTQEKLDNQRQVVMNERRQSIDNAPYGPSSERLVQLLFPADHPYYGYVIGSMSDLEAASLDDVRGFFTRYYAPANATLVIAGDFDPTTTRALVERYFGSLPRRPAPEPRTVTTPPLAGEKRVEVGEPVTLPRVQMGWLTPPYFAPGDADADLLAAILGHGRASRLYRRLVYELQLAQDVDAAQESLALASIFTVTVVGRPGVAPERLAQEVDAVLAELRTTPPTEREIERVRNTVLTGTLTTLQYLGGFGGVADRLNTYNHYLGDPGALARDLERYRAVTGATLLAFARDHLRADARAVVTTVPQP